MDLNKKLEELKPHQLNCNVFDVYSYNGLSMQDLLCQFFTKINECITVSNETIDLSKWLVNEGLEIEVVKKLMVWLEDGTLENVINVNLFNTLNEKINGFGLQLDHVTNNHIYISEFNGSVQEAIDYCINNKCDLIINKDLTINQTLKVNNANGLGCRIVGTKNKPTITIDSDDDIPLFYFCSGSGFFSNTGIENITLATKRTHLNTAIKINGVCNGKFNNIFISGFRYGIHLCNDTSAGVFTELNNFYDITLNNNINGIRMEQLLGDNSFHGNNFESVYINVYDGQIGFNHVSGYYYNGNFRLYMWSHSENAVYLNANGNAENNIGSITYESFRRGKVTGSGRFWFNGILTGIGGFNDETTIKNNGEKIISCNNYKKTINHEIVGNIISMFSGDQYNGVNPGIYGVSNDNEKSFLINGFNYGSNSKIYFGVTGYNYDLDKFIPGLHFTLNGNQMKTYNNDGFSIIDKDGNLCAKFNNGKIYFNGVTGNVGNHNKVTISASSEIQTITLEGGIQSSDVICLASVIIKGSNYEQRMLYSVNHNGYGSNGSCTKLSTHYTLNASGVDLKSVTVDNKGNLVISIQTDRNLTIITKYQGIGVL